MRINTNISALNSYNQLKNTTNAMNNSLERLSSGRRINRASDDAAGLAISEKMNSQIKGLDQAQRNSQDAISMIQTAEGALKETHSMLQRMRELSVQAANDSNTTSDRKEIQKEVYQLSEQIDDIAGQTQFNTKELLDGSLSGAANALSFQVGANKGENMEVQMSSAKAADLGTSGVVASKDGSTGNINLTTVTGANNAIGKLDKAISEISSDRSKLGAVQNRLEHSINNVSTTKENLTAANSRIRDVDMAKEMMNLSKTRILSQAGTAMLAQANQKPQGVLQLLG